MEKKIDITSTALEKGVDVAKSFLDKLIMPAIEEVGLLMKDHVTMWKFKNQIYWKKLIRLILAASAMFHHHFKIG